MYESENRLSEISENVENASRSSPNQFKDVLIVRTCEDGDREGARELLKAHHASTMFAEHKFSDKKFDLMADQIVERPDHMVCLIAELNGRVVGLVWAVAGSYSLSEDLVLTTCHVIAVHPTELGPISRAKAFLKLIKNVKIWSKTRNSDHVMINVTTGSNLKVTDRLLRRAGASCVGGSYVV